ncbi:MAG TPA: ROK family transcriptional regulator [Pseudonocardia sp.]|nr:ROK family transcriptional regulator [Pseudonocardia sp.]
MTTTLTATPTATPLTPRSAPRTRPFGRPPAAAVLDAARRAGPICRDELATATALSHATVNRQVTRLLDVGLLRERPDLVPAGAVGRPRVPVELDPDEFGVLGIHIGRARTTLAAGDLRGRVLDAVEIPTPSGAPADVVTLLTARLRRFGARWPGRRMLRVGLVLGGQPGAAGRPHPVAELAARFAGSDVVVVPQLEAMVGAETLLTRHPADGTTLYVYARDAVASVLTVDGALPGTGAGAGTISHLPVGGAARCHCGATGCLEASVGDAAVAAAAHAAGIVRIPDIAEVIATAERGDRAAHELLVERATLLGRGVALARDVLDPDRVVLLGQAFTGYRAGLDHVRASFAATSVLAPLGLGVSALGAAPQALAACTAALRPVYADPLEAVRSARPRPHGASAEQATARRVNYGGGRP